MADVRAVVAEVHAKLFVEPLRDAIDDVWVDEELFCDVSVALSRFGECRTLDIYSWSLGSTKVASVEYPND